MLSDHLFPSRWVKDVSPPKDAINYIHPMLYAAPTLLVGWVVLKMRVEICFSHFPLILFQLRVPKFYRLGPLLKSCIPAIESPRPP